MLNTAMGMFYLFGYGFVNKVNSGRTTFFDLALPGETSLPFIPAFIYVYCVPFVMIGVAMFACPLADRRLFHRVVGTLTLNVVISFFCFLTMPTQMFYRAELPAEPTSLSLAMVQWFYGTDRPNNCFPSMHVSLMVIAAWALSAIWPRHRWLYWTLTVGVMASVVLVKQHYIADAVAGFALGTALHWMFIRPATRERAAST
ncbi:MAG: phosphatase PAP2 family protein [Myxococcales bacterium]|nr:phosphatase PAP2 family protein [Myxococcales bacterium]